MILTRPNTLCETILRNHMTLLPSILAAILPTHHQIFTPYSNFVAHQNPTLWQPPSQRRIPYLSCSSRTSHSKLRAYGMEIGRHGWDSLLTVCMWGYTIKVGEGEGRRWLCNTALFYITKMIELGDGYGDDLNPEICLYSKVVGQTKGELRTVL